MPFPVKNYIIRDIANTLDLLGSRRLAERENENRVDALARRFMDARKEIERRHAKIISSNPTPAGWEDTDLPIAVMEARQFEYNELMEETQELRNIPENLYLTEKDLPKLMKGEAGDQNRVGLSRIQTYLHFLWKGTFDLADVPVVDGTDGTAADA